MCGRRCRATGCRADRPGPTAGRGHRHTRGRLAPRPAGRSDSWRTLGHPRPPPVGGLRPAAPGCWRVRSGGASNRRRWYRGRSWHAPGWQVGWMSCGADGPTDGPRLCPAPGFDTGRLSPACGLARVRAGFVERGREAVAVTPFRVSGGGRLFCRLRFPSLRPVRRLCRSCWVCRLAGENAGSGFEFGSRFDDMPRGARGFCVNG